MIHALSINITIPFCTPEAGVLDGGLQQAAFFRSFLPGTASFYLLVPIQRTSAVFPKS
ncbi:hypothetical protein [Bacillus sp. AG4(2022)]|uniref:hypothetical protein n=1 Tax=Bacillus sp. AG4(2022) TaxID=2962594 RepID=UPI0028813163|nr:hypothetical protein [Bacillus sp. AG4(2022)]MDT0161528.1 hypothetical protein [Bacillus sp. AG4(2022)]